MTYDPDTGKYGRPRLIERDWLTLLARFESSLFTCPCGEEQILAQLPAWCGKCGGEVGVWNHLRLTKYDLPLHPGTRVLRCQVGECADRQALDPILSVHADGAGGGYYITNDGDTDWKCVTTKGQHVLLPPGGRMPVRPGIRGEIAGTPFEIV